MSNVILKAARGRGNQGDWAKTQTGYRVDQKHVDHNAAVEAKRQAKLARRRGRK